MNKVGLHDAFAETNGVKESKREATCQHGGRCIYHALATDGVLRNVRGCELTEWSEIVESDHRGHLTDVDFSECFVEDFAEDDESAERNLNPNRKTYRDKFVEKRTKLLDRASIESELNEVNGNFDHCEIEQIYLGIAHVLMKARKTAEGDTKRNDKSSEQRKLRATLACWKLKLRKKDGTNTGACNIQKRVDVAC